MEVDEPLLSDLVQTATFSNMRSNFEKFVPGQDRKFWHKPQEFLKKGTNGQWQGALAPDLLARFDVRLNELAGDEMGHWMLYGNGPP